MLFRSFFEYGTLAALLAFRARGCALVVLEVGLGGRLDATNIIDADVAVLCSVGLDHTDWLGPTREHIGREKAGIFRTGHPVVLGSADMPATVVEATTALGCDALWPGREFRIERDAADASPQAPWSWRGTGASLAGLAFEGLPAPALPGPIQYDNAAAAIAAFMALARRRPEIGRAVADAPARWVATALRGKIGRAHV